MTLEDLAVDSLRWAPDTSIVKHAFGSPSSVRSYKRVLPEQAGTVALVDWRYSGLVLTFGSAGLVHMATITSPRWRTRRGLRVGDPKRRVISLYGDRFGSPNELCYFPAVERFHDSTLGLCAIITNGRVTRIMFGHISDPD